MNKLPTKQIYLLSIIVFGLITLSIYSTYAIFTLESSTSDIVSMNTPNSLQLSLSTDEYRLVVVPKNSYITTDIDVYNNYSYDICYSIWYKVLTSGDLSKVKVYQNTNESLTTTGSIGMVSGRRNSIIITNDNDTDVKVKIGLVYTENSDTCELNIDKDKLQITNTISVDGLLTKLIENNNPITSEMGYLTYKEKSDKITLPNKLYVGEKFDYKDELFTLIEPKEIDASEIVNYLSNDDKNYYTCIDTTECRFLKHIISAEETEENNTKYYNIIKYDELFGYLAGENGLRKLNNEEYVYYGDNPNNFIYYNCANELDTKTCELWRIVGFIKDEDKYITKIIKDESIGEYKYSDNSQLWKESDIFKLFDNEYKLLNDSYLKEIKFKQVNMPSLDEIKNLNDDEIKTKITIMDVKDYQNASVCKDKLLSEFDANCFSNNWLNKYTSNAEWTMTAKYLEPYKDEETEETITPDNDTIYKVGSSAQDIKVDTALNIRPVVYLKDRVLLTGGNGTIDNPYMIR